jgi:threonine dehydrogenase-like Zn-dependent dehydrogenase
MKALTSHGKGDIRCESVADPKIEDDRDAIIKVTACAICGSDLVRRRHSNHARRRRAQPRN